MPILGMPDEMIYRYIALTNISKIEERFCKIRKPDTVDVGEKAEMIDVSTGWWIVTNPPEPYAVCVGNDKPDYKTGISVKLILEIGQE